MQNGEECQVRGVKVDACTKKKSKHVVKKLATVRESTNGNTLATGKNKHRENRTKSKTRILALQ